MVLEVVVEEVLESVEGHQIVLGDSISIWIVFVFETSSLRLCRCDIAFETSSASLKNLFVLVVSARYPSYP